MKKLWRIFPLCLAALALSACGTGGAETSSPPLSGASGTASWEGAATTQEPAEAAMHIRVQAGTLAYYAPWGDVVMFYDAYDANGSLYQLGQAVSGAEEISGLSGSITIQPME